VIHIVNVTIAAMFVAAAWKALASITPLIIQGI